MWRMQNLHKVNCKMVWKQNVFLLNKIKIKIKYFFYSNRNIVKYNLNWLWRSRRQIARNNYDLPLGRTSCKYLFQLLNQTMWIYTDPSWLPNHKDNICIWSEKRAKFLQYTQYTTVTHNTLVFYCGWMHI